MFSKQLIIKAVDSLPKTHNELEKEIIKLDLETKFQNYNKESGSIDSKKTLILDFLLSNQGARDNHGDSIVLNMMNNLVKKILANVENGIDEFNQETFEFKSDNNFYRYLRLDGYDIDFSEKKIIDDLATYTHVFEKDDNIEKIMKKYKFDTSLEHYKQAKSAYINAAYAGLNSQLRTFVESIFQDMACFIKVKESAKQNKKCKQDLDVETSMCILSKCTKPILDIQLNEWNADSQKKSYFPSFWKRLHPEGSHPGIPEFEEGIYRFQLVVLNIELLMNRFQKNYPLK